MRNRTGHEPIVLYVQYTAEEYSRPDEGSEPALLYPRGPLQRGARVYAWVS